MSRVSSVKSNIEGWARKLTRVRSRIDQTKSAARNSLVVNIAYWLLVVFVWWPIKFSFLFLYYALVWPVLKILGSSTSMSLPESPGRNTRQTPSQDRPKPSRQRVKIQVFRQQVWEDASGAITDSDRSGNYIALYMGRIKAQNGGCRVRAIDMDTGSIVDTA